MRANFPHLLRLSFARYADLLRAVALPNLARIGAQGELTDVIDRPIAITSLGYV